MKTSKLLTYTFAISALFVGWTSSAEASPTRFMEMNAATSAPIGHKQFCADNASACRGSTSKPVVVKLSKQLWQQLIDVNSTVNRKIQPMTDMDYFGREEYWTYPVKNVGDCEEYVLEKQRILMAAGWPKSALLITVAKDIKNAGHAVLTVRTDQGDMILDNQIEAVLPWYATPYRYIKRQSPKAPAKWTGINDTRATTVSSLGN